MRRVWALVLLVLLVPGIAYADPPTPECDKGHVQCLIIKYWDYDDAEALDVAECESHFNEHAQKGQFTGVFQLGSEYHSHRAREQGYTWDDMYDAGKNTQVAEDLYEDNGRSWGPWECKP